MEYWDANSGQVLFEYSEPDTTLFLYVFSFLSAVSMGLLVAYMQYFNALLAAAIAVVVLTQMDMPATQQLIDLKAREISVIHKNLLGDKAEKFAFIKAKELNLETFTSYYGEGASTVCLRLELRSGRTLFLGGVRVFTQETQESLRELGKKLSAPMVLSYNEKEFGD